jgi:hypothetical protein
LASDVRPGVFEAREFLPMLYSGGGVAAAEAANIDNTYCK